MEAVWEWLPTSIDRRIRVFAWLSLATELMIVGTGGAVRLTGSGLGCPTWPRCTADSLVPTPEMGVHGAIEFGNRLMSFLLIVVALGMFVLLLRLRKERPELFRLAFALGIGIVVQAVIGGITVLTSLNPGSVGVHFMASALLVALATILVYRVHQGRRGALDVPRPFAVLVYVLAGITVLTVYAGTLTTGAGPHAGDSLAARNGLDAEVLQHVHSWPGYAMFALTLLVGVLALRARRTRLAAFAGALLGAEVVQIAVGIAQARLGLPGILVGAHMVLACVLVALLTALVLSLRTSLPSSLRS